MRKQDFSTSISESSENLCLFIFISVTWWLILFGVCFYIWYFFNVVKNKLLELIKRRSKVQQNKMSSERALNFDQWKTFSENYRPMRDLLWLVYKFTKNYCCLQLISEFIQTEKSYPTSLDKVSVLTWKLLITSS